MKKLLSILMSLSIIICSLFCFNSAAFADGWINYVQEVNLDQTNATAFDSTDFNIPDIYTRYYKPFKFTIPEKGIISVNLESNSDDLSEIYTGSKWCSIFKSTNLEHSIWTSDDKPMQSSGYMSAYDIYYSKRNVSLAAGEYYLVFSCTNDYYLNTEFSFTLNYTPTFPNTTISKLTPKKKSFKVNFKNCSNVSDYQIKYSTDKKMTSSKKVKVSPTASSKTIKSLKSKKTYYVKVRTYKTVNVNGVNKTYYGKWSKAKTVKTK